MRPEYNICYHQLRTIEFKLFPQVIDLSPFHPTTKFNYIVAEKTLYTELNIEIFN